MVLKLVLKLVSLGCVAGTWLATPIPTGNSFAEMFPLPNCNDACEERGLVCTDEALHRHLSQDAKTSDQMFRIIKTIDPEWEPTITNGDEKCFKLWGEGRGGNEHDTIIASWVTFPGAYSQSYCQRSDHAVTQDEVRCSAWCGMIPCQRLCWCHEGEATTTTTTTTFGAWFASAPTTGVESRAALLAGDGPDVDGHNCNDACEGHGLVCTDQALYEHQADVATSSGILDIIKTIVPEFEPMPPPMGVFGGSRPCWNFTASRAINFPNASAFTLDAVFHDGNSDGAPPTCSVSDVSISKDEVHCSAACPNEGCRRLCWCHEGEAVSTTLI